MVVGFGAARQATLAALGLIVFGFGLLLASRQNKRWAR